jgi:benzoate/toluate 1,2-dioxygenase reductase component
MRYVSRVTGRRFLSPAVFELVGSRPEGFSFQAGQNLRLLLDGQERDYTPVSGPADPDLVLLVRQAPGGTFSSFLASVPVGSGLSFTGPHGRFLFRPSERKPVFVATGVGIAPFVSMARSGVSDCTVLHGVRGVEDLYYREILCAGAARYVGCISASNAPEETCLFPGRVTDFVGARLPEGNYDFYLCGREEMVREVTALVDDRFPGSRVFSEVFG